MTTSRKVVLTLSIIGLVGLIAGLGTLSAFSSQTSNSGNAFDAGTVYISDNDLGAAMYNVTNRKPGDSVTQCISVTYTGTLDANVRLYTTSSINAVGQYIGLTIDKGTATGAAFPGCGTFTSQATIYSGTLADFASTKSSYANGVAAFPGAAPKWGANDSLVYRFTLTLQDDNNANGGAGGALPSGTHSFTWEARNQ